MAWSQSFIKALGAANVTPKYILRFTNMPNFAGDTATVTGGYASNVPLQISDEGPTISSCTVTPQTWNISFGSWSVPLVGDITYIFPAVRKGSIAELYCILGGIKERIAVGQLRNISGYLNNWRLDFVDIITAMTARASAETGDATAANPDKTQWFYDNGFEAKNTTGWNNSAGNFPTTIVLDEIRPFIDNKEYGEHGLARCVVGSDEFYITYSAATQTTPGSAQGYLTLSKTYTTSDKEYPSLKVCKDMPINSSVFTAALLKGKPYEIFGKLLLSRDGNNSNYYDKYPKSWTFGGYLKEDMYDLGDARNQKYIKSTSENTNPYKWDLIKTSIWSNGIREFIQNCIKTGQFPVYRQDSITWRGCRNPNNASNIAAYIRDDQMIAINRIDMFSPNQKAIYKRAKHTYGQTTGTNIESLTYTLPTDLLAIPALSIIERDNRFTYGYSPYTEMTKRQQSAQADGQRMFPFDRRFYSKINITLPLYYAFLCVGDIVELRSQFINVFVDTQDGLRGMVTAHSYSIGRQEVNIDLCVLGKVVN